MLIGREEECARIERLLEDARGGRSQTLVIRGEAGIGKSALLEHAVERAVGMQLLRARGTESEAELAFSGLLELCRPIVDRLDELPARQAAALRAAFALAPAEAGDRFTIAAATLSLLASAAEQIPVLVAVDDAHWLDRASTEALLFAARRLEADSVALTFAVREGEGVFPADGLDEILLQGLEPRDAATLLAAVSPAAVAPAVAQRLCTLTGGNPLALVELPRTLSREQLYGTEPLAEPLRVGKEVERAFARRAAALGERTRRALVLAAANETDQLELTATGLAVLAIDLAALQAAEDVDLVQIEDGRLTFRHPLVRSAVYQSATASERRAAHAALAEALAAAGSEDERRAWHLAAATIGADDEVAAALERAAADARSRSGYSGATAAYEQAARLTTGRTERVRRLYCAADAAWLAGRTGHAVALIEEALDECGDSLLRAELLSLRGHIEHHSGHQRTAYELLIEAATLFAPTERAKAVAALADAFECCLVANDTDTGIATAWRLFELAHADGGAEEFVAHLALGCALTWIGETDRGAALLEHALSFVEEEGTILATDPRHLAWATVAPGWLDQPERGRNLATRVVAQARDQGAASSLPHGLRNLSLYNMALGQWASASAFASECATLARDLGQLRQMGHALYTLALIESARGSEQSARAHIAEAKQVMDLCGVDPDGDVSDRRLGLLELSLGRHEAAIATLEPLVRRLHAGNAKWPDPEEFADADLIEAQVRSGRADEARVTLSSLPSPTTTCRKPWLHALTLRCRGLLAGDDFEAHFAEALSHHAEAGDVFEQARTRLCLGERLRRAGRRKDARDQLRRALAAFDELGATAWAERTRSELRASGETLRRRDPTAAEQLTPQELQIALQVAEGKTNREVGAKLFLSPKTVEFHLGHVFRKLDIHSRAELIRRVAVETAGGHPVAPARASESNDPYPLTTRAT